MENERIAAAEEAKKVWSTPRVLVSDQPVRETQNASGTGVDAGGDFLTSHS